MLNKVENICGQRWNCSSCSISPLVTIFSKVVCCYCVKMRLHSHKSSTLFNNYKFIIRYNCSPNSAVFLQIDLQPIGGRQMMLFRLTYTVSIIALNIGKTLASKSIITRELLVGDIFYKYNSFHHSTNLPQKTLKTSR